MSLLQTIIELISTPTEGERLSDTVLLSNLIVSSIGLIITTLIFVIILYQWFSNEDLRDQILPILIIGLALTLRVLVNVTSRYIEYIYDNQRELIIVNVFQTIPWILVYTGIIPVFKDIIRVPQRREYQINRIIRLTYMSIIGLVVLTITGFLPTGDAIGGLIAIVGLFFVTVVLWILVVRIWRESRQNASKLVVIRLQMVALGNLMIAISFSSTPVVIFMAISGSYGATAIFINNLITILLSVIAQYFFYGTFFTPNWMKQRHGLVSPQSALI